MKLWGVSPVNTTFIKKIYDYIYKCTWLGHAGIVDHSNLLIPDKITLVSNDSLNESFKPHMVAVKTKLQVKKYRKRRHKLYSYSKLFRNNPECSFLSGLADATRTAYTKAKKKYVIWLQSSEQLWLKLYRCTAYSINNLIFYSKFKFH